MVICRNNEDSREVAVFSVVQQNYENDRIPVNFIYMDWRTDIVSVNKR
jgi:hypothetical protein